MTARPTFDDSMEEFALSPFEEKKDCEVFKNAGANSNDEYYAILYEQLSSETQTTEKEKVLLEKFRERVGESVRYQRLRARYELRQFTKGSNELPSSLTSFLKDKFRPYMAHRPDDTRVGVDGCVASKHSLEDFPFDLRAHIASDKCNAHDGTLCAAHLFFDIALYQNNIRSQALRDVLNSFSLACTDHEGV